MNVNDYNYINGYFYFHNNDSSVLYSKYTPFGTSVDSYYSWSVQFESVKMSTNGVLAEHLDSDTDGWRVGITSGGHPYVYWSRNSSIRNYYYFDTLTTAFDSWFSIKFELTSSSASGSNIRCTLNGSTENKTVSGRWNNNYNRDVQLGCAETTIRGIAKITGYWYGSNTLQTAEFNLDNISVGATSATVNGDTYTLSSAVQKHLSTYTVAYSANGGSGTVSPQTKTYGVPLTLRSSGYTRDGYTLAGWADQNTSPVTNYSLGGTYERNAAALMYARWTQNTYSVTFNANGGSGTQASMTKYGGTDLTLPSSTTFTYTGRHITAWLKGSASGTAYALGSQYKDNAAATFYAKWAYNTYSIKFNANGGSGTMANESMTYGTAKNLTANAFTREGYRFIGWATSSSGSVVYTDGQSVNNLTTTNNGTVNLYAVWQASGIRVKHNGTWKEGQVYVKHNGTWKLGQVFAKHNGQWKEGT